MAGDDVGDFDGESRLQGQMGAVQGMAKGRLSRVGLVLIPMFDMVFVVEEGLAQIMEHAGGQGEIGIEIDFLAIESANLLSHRAGDSADASEVVRLGQSGDVKSSDHAGAPQLLQAREFGFGQGERVGLRDLFGQRLVRDFADLRRQRFPHSIAQFFHVGHVGLPYLY